MTKDEVADLNMELIGYVGTAKSEFLEAIDEALDGNIEAAEELIKQGQADFVEGHKFHAEMLQAFANGEDVGSDMLSTHAQCQMMSAEDFLTIALKVVEQCKKKAQ